MSYWRAEARKGAQPVSWGGFSGYFADPDGDLWEVACGSAEYAAENGDPDRIA